MLVTVGDGVLPLEHCTFWVKVKKKKKKKEVHFAALGVSVADAAAIMAKPLQNAGMPQ